MQWTGGEAQERQPVRPGRPRSSPSKGNEYEGIMRSEDWAVRTTLQDEG